MRGCEGGALKGEGKTPAVLPGPPEYGGGPQDTCPRRLILDEPQDFYEALHLYRLYDNGILMYDGAIADQPLDYMGLMRIIGSAIAELEGEMVRRARGQSPPPPPAPATPS